MEEILQWGIDLIKAIQLHRGPFLDVFFINISALGGDTFYFLVFSFLYWCVDDRETARFTVLFCLSFWINSELKRFLGQPRPYFLDPELKVSYCSGGGGMPSYHAQGSFLFWGYLSVWFRRIPLYVFSIIIVFLIAFSRIYLGHHFPTDILGGWFISLLLLLLFMRAHVKIEAKIENRHFFMKVLLAFLLPLFLTFIKPNAWTVGAMGFLTGFGTGYCILREYIPFNTAGGFFNKLGRYAIGVSGLVCIFYPMHYLFPADGTVPSRVLLFIRFMIMGLWMSAGAPWVFT
ncbi:MAG: phosphatase PAP2 family protein, partial [Spirochaetes bacterium]|nr:phosphatase PAP2 family protein [Spirochaetota bacterium]